MRDYIDLMCGRKRSANACIASVLRAARCTLLPSSANASAVAAPMPFDAPVISTLLPADEDPWHLSFL